MKNTPTVLPGQIYQENDPRFERKLRVVSVEGEIVYIETIPSGRKSKAKLKRFGRESRGNYRLIEDVKK